MTASEMSDTFAIIGSPEAALASSPSGSNHSTEETSSPHNEPASATSPNRPNPPTADNNSTAAPSVPPAKADKPRPHVCGTCQRPFARLEHLKRHERSHTKEKPFECNNCSRSFARRDLLLRHQQKLHQTGAPPTKKGGPRRESTSGAGPSKVRKNSITGGARPRANTISHVDPSTLGMIAQAKQNVAASIPGESKPPLPASDHSSMKPSRGMAAASGNHGNPQALPRLATHNLHSSSSEALRTAPPGSNMGSFNGMSSFPPGCASTINPAHLHMSDPMSFCGSPFDTNTSPFTPQPMIKEEENDMDLSQGFTQMSFDGSTIQSPHLFGDQSHCFGSLDPSQLQHSSLDARSNGNMEANQVQHNLFDVGPSQPPFQMNWADMMMPPDCTTSPHPMGGMDPTEFSSFQSFAPVSENATPGSMHAPQFSPENSFPYAMNSAMPMFRPQDLFPDLRGQPQPQMTFGSDGASGSSPSNSARQSSATSVSTDPQFVKLDGEMPQSMDSTQRFDAYGS